MYRFSCFNSGIRWKMVDRKTVSDIFSITIIYSCLSLWNYVAWKDFFKLNKYVTHQCQVDSFDVTQISKEKIRNSWNVTVIDEAEKGHVIVDAFISTSCKKSARYDARKYQVLFTCSFYLMKRQSSKKIHHMSLFTSITHANLMVLLSTEDQIQFRIGIGTNILENYIFFWCSEIDVFL
jgi:hypothetical protein